MDTREAEKSCLMFNHLVLVSCASSDLHFVEGSDFDGPAEPGDLAGSSNQLPADT